MTSTDEKGRFELRPIAYIRTPYKDNFGVPRQSGMVRHTASRVEFTPEFRDGAALRGLEEFSHVWLIWQFSEHVEQGWSPTVRPPRLGGNERRGVFATRSPFRPNPLGLSCVELLEVGKDKDGPYLLVDGADMLDGSPIYDVKPYLPFSDSHPRPPPGTPQASWITGCRWRSATSCWPRCPPRISPPCGSCWPWTPGPATSTTRSGSTVWISTGCGCAFPWRRKRP